MDRKKNKNADSPARLLDGAVACHQRGDLTGAVAGYRAVLAQVPGNVDAGHLLGLALWQSGQQEEGLRRVMAAAAAAPGAAAIQNNLGGMLMALREFRPAERAFRAALAARPELVDAQSNLAAVLLELNRPAEAEEAARKALAAAPGRADAWSNRGVALLELGRFAEAEKCQRKALSLDPKLAVAHANLGTLLRRAGKDGQAVDSFRRAVALDGDQPVARFNLSLDHLAVGRLAEGWADYELRFRARQRQAKRNLDIPFWQGEMLAGRHLLVWPEQGLGDEILFASVLPDLDGIDGPVSVECDARLVPLFARSFPHLRVAAAGGVASADLQIAVGSLPGLARPVLSRFTGRPWLTADPARAASWRQTLAGAGPAALTVGFCWRSGLKSAERQGLYPSLADFAPLFALPGIRWVPLQYDLDEPGTAAELSAGLPDGIDLYRPPLDLRDDLDGVAALMAGLDLVVSAATAVAELAGALGVPVWRIGADDDWTRLGAAVRPWYGSTRCFTLRQGGTHGALLAGMARELRALLPDAVPGPDPATLPPLPPDALERATVLVKDGQPAAAVALCRDILARRPDDAAALHLLGHALMRDGRPADALAPLERAVALRPGDALALTRLGAALRGLGRTEAALQTYRQAARLWPDNALIAVNIGLCQLEGGEPEAAAATLRAAIAAAPQTATAHDALGLALLALGDAAGAAAAHRAALAIDPRLLAGWVNLAAAAKEAQRYAEAVDALEQARHLDPDRVEVWTSLGYALFRTGRAAAAEAALDRALSLVPDHVPALIDLSRIREAQQRPAEARALLDRALSREPGDRLARWNRALLALAQGDLATGWSDYAIRFAAGEVVPDRHFAIPAWHGQPLAGRRLLVWREQGLGDEILFMGQVADLLGRGAEVVVECDRRLTGLLARSFPAAQVRAETADPRDADFQCPVGGLPALLRPALADFPGGAPAWMRPDPALAAAMATRLGGLPPGLRVGFCWRSQLQAGDRALSYLRPRDLLPVLTLPGLVPVSLQYDGGAAEIAELADQTGVTLHRFPDIDLRDDLEAAAALIAGLDLVITAGTAVGEMAGAVGVPVWRFQATPDWSGLGTAVRPWFSCMRLFTAARVTDTVPLMRRELLHLLRVPSPGAPEQVPAPAATTTAPPLPLETVMDFHRAGDLPAAEDGYRAILAAQPDDPDALHLLSQVLFQTRRAVDALPLVDRALALDPDFAAAHNTRGSLLKAMGRYAEAEKAFRQALAHRVDFAEAWTNLGATLLELRRPQDAEKAHRRALTQRPVYPRAQANLGIALRHMGRYGEAVEWHEKALATAPDLADAWSDLGLCRAALGDVDEGLRCQDRALAAAPDYAEAEVNRSMLLAGQGLVEAARAALSDALAIRPDFPRALYNDGLLALGQGDIDTGWQEMEARFDSGEVAWSGPLDKARWEGLALAGRRLLVWREQGLGDEIMFARHYRGLEGLGGKVKVWADPRLVGILARSFPFLTVLPDGTPVEIECHTPAGSLPLLLEQEPAQWDPAPYLVPREDLAELWRQRLAELPPGLRVGLCWRSQLQTADRVAGYTALADWLPLLSAPDIQVVSLQYDGALAEIAAVEADHGVRLHRWEGVDLRDDLETALALTAGLDLVVTVATAVGEMAGALGVPVWRLSGPVDWTRLGTDVRPGFGSMIVLNVPVHLPAASQVQAVMRRLQDLKPSHPALPDGDPAGWLERGIALQKSGDPAGAMPFYQAVIGREGEQPVALHLLGLALQQIGRGAEGLDPMRRALAAAPDYVAAWVNLGNLWQELDQPREAEAAYRQALALQPRDAGTWTNLGNALRAQRRYADAVKAHQRAIAFDPAGPAAHGNLAVVWKEMDAAGKAVAAYHQALDLGGDEGMLRAGLGDALRLLGDLPAARRQLARVLDRDPGNAEAWNNLGRVHEAAADKAAARGAYDQALVLAPDLPSALYNRGLMDLAAGRLAAGWAGYAARFRGTETIRGRSLPLPVWDGGDLAGRRLLVWGEQGLGDQLMFASLYPALLARCAHLVIEADARLVSLFTRAFPTATVRAPTPCPADADLAVAAGDVARHLWPHLSAQSPTPYLQARTDRVAIWRDRLAATGPGLKIGVCWRSALLTAERKGDYARLSDLAPLAAVPGVTLVSLQRGEGVAGWDDGDVPLLRLPDLDMDDDLEGQAALITALDLVITAPTAVGELAGALGVPVWRLSPPDWTSLGTGVRPWFPGMRLLGRGCGMGGAVADAVRLLLSARRS
ncbi:tetratricopeptide repeat protein [Niveispirillum fermenti]|uniref:tetratricopeptide repeat protein n=1 Tax=Niveispirillum fermenti TaxID=1233113 RepID=UPI003A845191